MKRGREGERKKGRKGESERGRKGEREKGREEILLISSVGWFTM